LLDYHEVEVKRQNLKEYVLPKGKITCALDASPLFDQQDESYTSDNANWISRAWQGFSNVRSIERHVAYSVEVKFRHNFDLCIAQRYFIETNKRQNFYIVRKRGLGTEIQGLNAASWDSSPPVFATHHVLGKQIGHVSYSAFEVI
jgi:hypothetical protein